MFRHIWDLLILVFSAVCGCLVILGVLYLFNEMQLTPTTQPKPTAPTKDTTNEATSMSPTGAMSGTIG